MTTNKRVVLPNTDPDYNVDTNILIQVCKNELSGLRQQRAAHLLRAEVLASVKLREEAKTHVEEITRLDKIITGYEAKLKVLENREEGDQNA